jgi:hypothetical protein
MSNKNNQSEQAVSMERLQRMITGGMISQSIYVVAKLGIPDLLTEGPRSSEDLAAMTDTHAPSLYRLLRSLASIGLFIEREDRKFKLGPLGSYLQSKSSGSLRGAAIMFGEKWHRESWTHLMYSIKTGKPAFNSVYGMGVFEYLSKNPEAGEIFNNAMTDFSSSLRPLLEAYDFSTFPTLIDVGGGHGSLIELILKVNPDVKGIVYDQPSVIEGTKKHMKNVGLEDRCTCIEGNFFDSVPSGGDAYIMKHIIHDWSDEETITILKNCRQAISQNGKLLLVEAVLPQGNDPHPAKFLDLEMLVMTTGRERTDSEFEDLFKEAGFKLTRIIPTSAAVSIIEGIPV